jgi:hypothetical protein
LQAKPQRQTASEKHEIRIGADTVKFREVDMR